MLKAVFVGPQKNLTGDDDVQDRNRDDVTVCGDDANDDDAADDGADTI